MRIVLDSSILVRALSRGEGFASVLLSAIFDRGHRLVLSTSILEEVEHSLRYPRLMKRYRLTDAGITVSMRVLAGSSPLVDIDGSVGPPIRDPKDVHVVQAAIAGGAEYLCTLDRHFYDEAAVEFCAR